MRTSIKKAGLFAAMVSFAITAFAQGLQPDLQYYRLPGYDGLNVFETPKDNDVEFDGVKVRVGGDFALQFQMINHEADLAGTNLMLRYIAPSVNLPTANLNLDAQLADGMRMHLRTYLSSRHHTEAWVKGGYIQIDKLDFISEGFAEGLMAIMTAKIGVDNFAYGDAVYRRSDNGMAIYNPFVGNYLMDNNTVEPFMELYFQPGDFIIVGGISSAILNPTVIRSSEDQKMPPSFHGKVGWDSQVNSDLRVRLTASIYTSSGYDNGRWLYSGDRAGARYYKVLDYTDTATGTSVTNDFSGRVNPGFRKQTAIQVNPFVKFMGLEFFGVFEMNSGFSSQTQEDNGWTKGSYTQLGAELIYRFGSWEQFFVGGRFNSVSGVGAYTGDKPDAMGVNRINIGGGWFFTKNVLIKIEYVSQSYNDQWSGNLKSAKFNGAMFEAVIGL